MSNQGTALIWAAIATGIMIVFFEIMPFTSLTAFRSPTSYEQNIPVSTSQKTQQQLQESYDNDQFTTAAVVIRSLSSPPLSQTRTNNNNNPESLSSSDKKRRNNNRILLVDDEPDISLLFTTLLKDEGFKVDSFTDPQLALSAFKPNLYDLVILDIKMPGMNGFELYAEMKKIDNKVKVCFLTASEMFYEEYRRKQEDIAADVTAVDEDLFLLKPVSNQDLIQKINKIMMSN